MSTPPETNRLEELRNFSAQLLQQLDQAQATIRAYNETIAAADAAGLLPPTFLVGGTIHLEPYDSDIAPQSGKAFVATLSIPNGFGAALWDVDELPRTWDESADAETRQRNITFAALPPRVQLRMLAHVTSLMDRLLVEIGARDLRSLPQFNNPPQ